MRIVTAIMLALLASPAVASPYGEIVTIKFDANYPHNADAAKWDWDKSPIDGKNLKNGWTKLFKAATPPESNIVQKDGELKATLFKPEGDGPFPYVVYMHGCSGLEPVLRAWTLDLSKILLGQNVGLLVLDSFTTRSVRDVCGLPAPYWGRRRADDAGSALDYLIANKLAKKDQVYTMGLSNGGSAAMNAVNVRMLDRKNKFAAAIGLEPGCGAMNRETFYAPIFMILASEDQAADPKTCMNLAKMKHKQPMQVLVMQGAHHGYMLSTPEAFNMVFGWRIGYNERAAKIAMQVIEDFFKNPKVRPITETK